MKKIIYFSKDTLERVLQATQDLPLALRLDYFYDIRRCFFYEIGKQLLQNGLSWQPYETRKSYEYKKRYSDLLYSDQRRFCAGYGHDFYSMDAINYRDGEARFTPALSSIPKLSSIGNILWVIGHEYDDVEFVFPPNIKVVDSYCHLSKKARKPYVVFLGISLDSHEIQEYTQRKQNVINQLPLAQRLSDFALREHMERQPYSKNFIDRYSGEVHVCDHRFRMGFCHECTGYVPKFGNTSSFKNLYVAYITRLLESPYLRTEIYPTNEALLRERLGYPEKGKAIREVILLRIVKEIFAPHAVRHRHYLPELQGLEADIWIPAARLIIEYQGEQHYQPLRHLGGEEGLRKRQQNDERKRALCRGSNIDLLEIHHSDSIDYLDVYELLRPYSDKAHNIKTS